MLKLIIEDDENQVKVVRLLRDEITIGRKEGNTIRLTERNVSRKHARLLKKNEDIVLEDMGSYNGVKVNGVKISEPVEIDEGDKILIGDYTLMLKVEEKSEVDPFEEMATIPVERLDEEMLKRGQAKGGPTDDSPTVQLPVQSFQQQPRPAKAPSPQPARGPQAAPAAASQPTSVEIPADKRAKLVVITSNYAGTTFELKTNSVIVGRNRENDVFIDHASLSAIHAKLSYDGNTYSIEDMGSKNGMLINGDEYSNMALRKGDVIQLGHVRFRFVAPGEVYDFASEAQHLDVGDHSNKTILIALGLVIGAGVIAFVLFSGMFGTKDKGDSASSKVDVSEALKQIETYKSMKDWEEGIKLAKSTLGKSGLSSSQKTKINGLLSHLREEKSHKVIITEIGPLIRKSKWADAARKALTIPKSSAYFNEAQAKVSTAKQGFLSNALAKSRTALTEKQCATINDYVDKAATFNFKPRELKELTDLAGKCKTGPEVVNNNMAPPTMHTTSTMNTKRTPSMDSGTPEPKTMRTPKPDMKVIMTLPVMTKEPETMSSGGGQDPLKEGKAAYRSGNCSRAVRKLKQAYAKTSSSTALRYIGLCGCKSRKKSWAKWAYSRLGGRTKKLIQKFCKKKGINL